MRVLVRVVHAHSGLSALKIFQIFEKNVLEADSIIKKNMFLTLFFTRLLSFYCLVNRNPFCIFLFI